MEAIVFALISYFTWGSGVLVEAIVARRMKPYSLIFWSYLSSFLILSLYVPFSIHELSRLTLPVAALNIVLAFGGIFGGTIFYFEALRRESRALIGTIASSFPIVTVILSILFLGDQVSLQQISAILLVFTGLILVSIDLQEFRSKKLKISRGILYALVAMMLWGIYFAFLKIPINQVGWFWPNYIAFLFFPLAFVFLKIKKEKLESPTKNNILFPLILSTILVRIAEFSYNYGISKGLVAIVAPIAGANPTLFVILAFLIFKDPITRQQVAGIIVTICGIVLLSFASI